MQRMSNYKKQDSASQRDIFGRATMIDLISGDELAARLLFKGPTSAFRKFCHDTGIRSVPGRKDCYDPVAVRQRLNLVQGLNSANADDGLGLLEMSKVRRNVKEQ